MTHPAVDPATLAADVLRERAPGFRPRLGIVLGSGLGGLADTLDDAAAVPYGEIPGFPPSTVAGHAGRFVLGSLRGVPVACMQGRFHLYEGHPPAAVKLPIRTFAALGVEALLLTNAAGSLRAEAAPGSLMLITDHLNLMWTNPLFGPNDDAWGERFVGLEDAYDPELRARLRRIAGDLGIRLHEGVYGSLLGPLFETPAEIRAYRVLGADAVGMSTVPEVIVARHAGIRVAALSAITNLAVGMSSEPIDHQQTLRGAALAAADLTRLVRAFAASFAGEPAGSGGPDAAGGTGSSAGHAADTGSAAEA
ncbi:MAG TPA: purine-nucleoside phosphorylase [Patescibacteria group bacterium]|nr:purine-nucleoside phosphorylase [Patescibacteria group bacterium]